MPAQPILVVVNLDGGNDWLYILPPSSGASRAIHDQKRPTLGVPGAGLLSLGGGIGVDGTPPTRTPSVPYPGEAAFPVKKLDGFTCRRRSRTS